MSQRLELRWQCFDAYARVSWGLSFCIQAVVYGMSLGVYQIVQVLGQWSFYA